MAKSKALQNRGGKLPDGSPNVSSKPKRNAGIALRPDLIEKIEELPQVKSKQWSKSYLVEQILRNSLGLQADYDLSDLELIAKGAIVE